MTTMQAEEGKIVENAKQSILLALFNKLDDLDKDTVIQLSESLVAKHKTDTNNKEKKA
jgi:hypothetical protein